MRDRLIELLEKAAEKMDCPQMDEVADYLLANGVIVPPCKVGDVVYCVGWRSKKVYSKNVEEILLREDEGYIYIVLVLICLLNNSAKQYSSPKRKPRKHLRKGEGNESKVKNNL